MQTFELNYNKEVKPQSKSQRGKEDYKENRYVRRKKIPNYLVEKICLSL